MLRCVIITAIIIQTQVKHACSVPIPSPESSTSSTISNNKVLTDPGICIPCACMNDDDGKIEADCLGINHEKFIPDDLKPHIFSLRIDIGSLVSYGGKTSGLCENFKQLGRLTLAPPSQGSTKVEKIPHGAFKGCAKTLEELDLSGNELTLTSPEALQHLQALTDLEGLSVSTPLDRKFFSPLKNLKHLELAYSGASSLPVDLFADLKVLNSLHLDLNRMIEMVDAPLEAPALNVLHLKAPKLQRLPKTFLANLMWNLTSLDLVLPDVERLQWPDRRQFSSLEHLSVKGVARVKADTLAGMNNLQTLQLTNIWKVRDQDLFQHLGKLEVLEIQGCTIETLPRAWFSKLTSLCDLNLTQDNLATLRPQDLTGLPNLRSLVLTGNQLSTIPRGFLDPVAETLEVLSLGNNKISDFGKERGFEFPYMKNLKDLDLSENRFGEFDLDLVSPFTPDLILLQLQSNMISSLTGQLAPRVQRVNVSYNRFKDVPDGLLGKAVMDLDISGNDPNYLPIPVAKIMSRKNLKELSIRGLVVKCNCEMRSLVLSKAVHGGECEEGAEDGSGLKGNRGVGDILNGLICEEEENVVLSPTSTLSSIVIDDGINERSLVDDGRENEEWNDVDASKNNDDNNSGKMDDTETVRSLYYVGGAGNHSDDKATESHEEVISGDDSTTTTRTMSAQRLTSDDGLYFSDNEDNSDDETANTDNSDVSSNMTYNGIDIDERMVTTVTNNGQTSPANSGSKEIMGEKQNTSGMDNEQDDDDVDISNKDIETKTLLEALTNAESQTPQENVTVLDTSGSIDESETLLETQLTSLHTTENAPEESETSPEHQTSQDQRTPLEGHDAKCTNSSHFHDTFSDLITTPEDTTVKETIVITAGNPNNKKSSLQGEESEHARDKNAAIMVAVIIIAIILVICLTALLVRRMRRTGSHRLDRRARIVMDEDKEHSKIVMTELGKTRQGQDVVVM